MTIATKNFLYDIVWVSKKALSVCIYYTLTNTLNTRVSVEKY